MVVPTTRASSSLPWSWGKNDDLGLHAQVLGDGALERRGDRRGVGFLAGEDHVAALNVGRHLGVAQPQHNLTQVGHGDPVAAADIDPAQQGDMGRHAVILPSAPTGWHRDGTDRSLTWHHSWCQSGAMNLELYVENLNRQLAVAAEAGGDEARALAERLVAPLEAAIRLTLQDALAAAVEEITTELAPGSVELRLRGRDPEFVVTPPPADPSADDLAEDPDDRPPAFPEGDEGTMSRINLRMPDHLKARIEQAAASEGLSVNAWLVRAAAAALERTGPSRRPERRASQGAQRYTGWAR
jgi:hypothetical protein